MTDLATLRPLVELMAAERTSSCPELFQDAVQEGLISAWRASQSHADASPAYIHTAARNAVTDVLRGRPFTGHEPRRGWQDAMTHSKPLDDWEDADPTAMDALERIERTYHCQEVRDAVAELDTEDRIVIHARFTDELDWKAAGARVGKQAEATRRRFIAHTVPYLQKRLRHLS